MEVTEDAVTSCLKRWF